MAKVIDKLVIANRLAMQTKYGPNGLAAVQAALQVLVTADQARGLVTLILYIDDARQMATYGGHGVVAPTDERPLSMPPSWLWRRTISCSSTGLTSFRTSTSMRSPA